MVIYFVLQLQFNKTWCPRYSRIGSEKQQQGSKNQI